MVTEEVQISVLELIRSFAIDIKNIKTALASWSRGSQKGLDFLLIVNYGCSYSMVLY